MFDVMNFVDLISVILFQALLPVAFLGWTWMKVRKARNVDFSKDRVYMTTNMRKGYV